MMQVLSRPRPTPNHIPLILTLACGAWLLACVVAYLLGVGFLTLLDIVGGVL
jgi:adenine/guanine phosphoribosyltransferase-like PRPP-binding protein